MNTCVACCDAPATSLACEACGQGVCCAPCADTYREKLVNNCCPFCRHAPLFADLSSSEQKQMRSRARDLVNPAPDDWASDTDEDDQTDIFSSVPHHMSVTECVDCGEFMLSGTQCPRCTLMNDVMLLQPVTVTMPHDMYHCTVCDRRVVAVPGETCLLCALHTETTPTLPWRHGRWNL